MLRVRRLNLFLGCFFFLLTSIPLQAMAVSCTGPYTWTQRNSTLYWEAAAYYANDTKLAGLVYNSGGGTSLYTSTNNGATLTQHTTPETTVAYVVYGSHKSNVLVLPGWSGNMNVSTNDGVSWTSNINIGSGDFAPYWVGAVVSDDGSSIIGEWGRVESPWGGTYTSSNGGTSWTSQGNMNSGDIGAYSVQGNANATAALRYAQTSSSFHTELTTNGGISWSTISSSSGWGYMIMSGDGSTIYATDASDHLQVSTNNGTTWTHLTSADSLGLSLGATAAVSYNGQVIAALGSDSHIHTSQNGGVTWNTEAPVATVGQDTPYTNGPLWQYVAMSEDGTQIAIAGNDQWSAADGGELWTASCPSYTNPPAPTISGPTTGLTGVAYTYNVTGTDPNGASINYGVSWNNDGTTNEYDPVSGYVTSGTQQSTTHTWNTPGTYTFAVRTNDSLSLSSSWQTYTVTIVQSVVSLISSATSTYRQGDPGVVLTWSSTGATSCTGSNFLTGNATSGTATVTPTATTTYTVTCTGPGGSANNSTTINYTPDQPPSAPSITGPTTTMQGTTNNTYTFLSSDPEGDTLRYGIDWNHDGVVDQWIPGGSTYQSSNTTGQTTYTWTNAGTSTFQVLAQDSRGQSSGWAQYTVSTIAQCVSLGGTPITGYAWSDNVGWIDLNCSNTNYCGTSNFGLTVTTNGVISGCAWSENLGWITASSPDLSSCPSTPCIASISNNASVSGWMKVINAAGWDGWIALAGSWTPSVTLQTASSSFTGFGWGSAPVGWVDFEYAHTSYTNVCSGNTVVNSCTGAQVQACSYSCYNGACTVPSPSFNAGTSTTGHLQIKPSLVKSGSPTWVYWNLSNASSCSVTGTNSDSWSGLSSSAGGATTSSIIAQTTYTLSCSTLAGATSTGVNETQTVNVAPVFKER